MVKLRHLRRRAGFLLVRGVKYKLDETGAIEVPEEHASLVLQGRMWRRVALAPTVTTTQPDLPPPPQPKEEEPPEEPEKPAERSLQDMTKAELLELAEEKGLEVDGRTSKLKLAALIREAQKEK